MKYLPRYAPDHAPLVAFVHYHAAFVLADYRRARQDCLAGIAALELQRFSGAGSGSDALEPLPIDPSPTPEQALAYTRATEALLRRIFDSPLPPHQLLVFGYVWLLDWRPAEIDSELAHQCLRDLTQRLSVDAAAQWGLPESVAEMRTAVLRSRMDRTLGADLQQAATRSTYASMLNRVIGDTRLRDYYTGAPTANLSHWWSAVRRALANEIAGPCGLRDGARPIRIPDGGVRP